MKSKGVYFEYQIERNMKTFIEAAKMVDKFDKTMACLRGWNMSKQYKRNVTIRTLTTGYSIELI